ncbi:MAG: hypothetical protein CBC13_04460 [Planctomycetia bacterium TMED53]|nr:MAG: hypothetical protein CBC13_04460 [Planctomycetia bacterium TMED53]
MDDQSRQGRIQLRPRYEETDQGGIIHHSRFVVWFETARTEWLREQGLPYRALEERGIRLLVSEVQVRYLRPAYYDDLITIETTMNKCEGARIHLTYKVLGPQGDELCRGLTVLACVDVARHRPTRLPAELVQLASGHPSTGERT